MLTTFKLSCTLDIEGTIDLPPKGFFVKNKDSMRLCYSIGQQIKYITLANPVEVAKFLKKRRMIDFYAYKDGVVTMYERRIVTTTGTEGQPLQSKRLVPVKWEDINLSKGQVQTFAAAHELELNKVVNKFIKEVFKAA